MTMSLDLLTHYLLVQDEKKLLYESSRTGAPKKVNQV